MGFDGLRPASAALLAGLCACGSKPVSDVPRDEVTPARAVLPAPSASAAPSARASTSAGPSAIAPATSTPKAEQPVTEPPGRLCVVFYEDGSKGKRRERHGYVDEAGRLVWIANVEDQTQTKLVWEQDNIVRIEGHDANGPTGKGTEFSFGAKGELVRVTFLPSRIWWEGTYQGTFGAKKAREPRWLFTVMRQSMYWPPHMPFEEGLTQPAFTGKLVVRYGQPQAYEVRCTLGGEGAGRCVDDYERVDTMQGSRSVKREEPREDVTRTKTRTGRYDGGKLASVEHTDAAGKTVYRTTYDYDTKGRPVRLNMTDFGSTDVTYRLEYKCDVLF